MPPVSARFCATAIELADASRLLPIERIFYKSNNVAPFADLLRYELLGYGLGLYVDCDVFCLRAIEDADYIFGGEDGHYLNVAVLKLPKDCPTLNALRAIKDTPDFWPPWKPDHRKRWLFRKPKPLPLERFNLGTTGPHALTYYAAQYGIDRFASPVDRFYPVHSRNRHLLVDPELSVAELITHRTDAIHVNHRAGRLAAKNKIPANSPVGELLRGTAQAKELMTAQISMPL
jgi:hypothetical protein